MATHKVYNPCLKMDHFQKHIFFVVIDCRRQLPGETKQNVIMSLMG